MDLLLPDKVDAWSDCDIVTLQLGENKLTMYYQKTFEVVNGVRMAAKLAMRHDGSQIPDWRDVLDSVKGQLRPKVKANRTYRRTFEVSNVNEWSVAWNGTLVILNFNELVCKIHYTDAFRLHAILRRAAQNAKAWAGDGSSTLRMTAYLNDAEENYKRGYAV